MRGQSCLFVYVIRPINLGIPEPIFMKLGMYFVISDPISSAHLINSLHQSVRLNVYPLSLPGNGLVNRLLGNEYTKQYKNYWMRHFLGYPCVIKRESVGLCIPPVVAR
jgi:hypothetical protein